MKLVVLGIEEIKKTLPQAVRDQLDIDFTKDIVALLPPDFEGAQETLLAELGIDAAQMNQVVTAATARSSDIMKFLADPKVCYMSEQQQSAKVYEILGFTPSIANIDDSTWPQKLAELLIPSANATGHTTNPKAWLMMGVGGGLN